MTEPTLGSENPTGFVLYSAAPGAGRGLRVAGGVISAGLRQDSSLSSFRHSQSWISLLSFTGTALPGTCREVSASVVIRSAVSTAAVDWLPWRSLLSNQSALLVLPQTP